MSTNATNTTPPRGGIHPGWLVAAVVVAVAAIGALVWALVGQDGDDQAAPEPTESPGTPSPEPSPTPTETSEPDAGRPLVAVTDAGAVVLVDAESGSTEPLHDGVTTSDPAKTSISLDPAAEYAYVSSAVDGDEVGQVLRVSLADGSAETVATGIHPSVSPDGATLAYAGGTAEGLALVLRDLSSGDERAVPAGFDGNPAAWLGHAAWARDSSRLFVPRGLEGSSLFALDADAATFDEATRLGDDTGESHPVVLADGTLLAYNDVLGAAPEQTYVSAIDPATGQVLRQVDELSGLYVADMAAHPDDERVALLIGDRGFDAGEGPSWDLYLWDGGGEPALLAEGFVAVGW